MKIMESLSRNAISALVVLSWVSVFLLPLRWALPAVLVAILIAVAIGSREDRSIAMISLLTLSLYSWYGVRHVEDEIVQDAFAAHRSAIGCSRFDKFMAFSENKAVQIALQKPTKEESTRCGQDRPIGDDHAEFLLDMEERGWGKYESARYE